MPPLRQAAIPPLLLVTDAGPLIALAVADVLPAVLRQFDLLVPQAVLDECLNDAYAPGAVQIAQAAGAAPGKGRPGFTLLPNSAIAPLDAAFSSGLGSGEAAVLSYAAQHQVVALVDERRARRVAQQLKVPVVGSGTVLLALKSLGSIASIRPALASWARHGYFVSPPMVQELLRRAGEA